MSQPDVIDFPRPPRLTPDKDMIKRAKEIYDTYEPDAVGYRLLVKPLEVDTGMKKGEAAIAPTLAEKGFAVTTNDQAKRETKGSDVGILISVGPIAFKASIFHGEVLAEVGDVVVFHRYAGKEIEIPPGSGNTFRAINDEDLFCRYPVSVLERSSVERSSAEDS